jgi:hypothetical protein
MLIASLFGQLLQTLICGVCYWFCDKDLKDRVIFMAYFLLFVALYFYFGFEVEMFISYKIVHSLFYSNPKQEEIFCNHF